MSAVPMIPTQNGAVAVTQAGDDLIAKFLTWFDGAAADDPRKTKWQDTATAARAEQKMRAEKPTDEPPPADEEAPTESLAVAPVDRAELAAIARVTRPDEITQRLTNLQQKFHLVAPATEVDIIPDGFGISVSMVTVNKADCYRVGDKLGLGKVHLEQIWSAAGGTWDLSLTGRLDDGREPRYCHYRAVGTVRNYDGTPRTVSGEVEIDMRDGSDLVNEIITKAERPGSKVRDHGDAQILELRKFLLRHAESKAKNRAIASIGVRRAYTEAELRKPFAVARLTFTGRTDNPRLQERFALMAAEAALGGAASLYGTRALPAVAAPPQLHPAPPVDQTEDPDQDPTNEGDSGGDEFGEPPL